ncbi:polysaccharide lyase family 1 protein [Cylindrobasidium torrendii FP15055 ss-10]|uniref:Polysaccharide lyase family 1 protein n=1 Tax=Cylindrobasidium torrendii FP15055 ss-10 TaxID=1314674 RepID=A0A0D7BPF8_9AGAR|nr:polysaccharide lyase family 1 protein [Cylindrobasidium torrendii FP15055 ss-10]
MALKGFKLLLGLLALLPSAIGLAFPGAEGFGAQATGGRGGDVYVVTNLNDSGTGSLRDAVSKSHRIVVFAVGGLITIDDRLVVSHDVTILGQTAPGQGITVYGNGVSYSNADNTITRYIRFRMGKTGDSGKDGITIAEGANMIFDHVSVSWGRDETFSINGDVSNVTISDSIIAQGLEPHSCGGLMQADGGISIFRTLYIDNKTRNAKTKGKNSFTNNVVYNWGAGGGYIAGDSDGQSYANIVGNVFISGPSTSAHPFTRGNANFHAYVSDNYYDPDQDGTLNGWVLAESTDNYSDVDFQASPYDYPAVNNLLKSGSDVFDYIKANAGASKSRDHVDDYLINTELASLGKTGALISDPTASPINGPGPIDGGKALTDTDGDGIPDEYESQLGTSSTVSDSATIASNGYANIENYANLLI